MVDDNLVVDVNLELRKLLTECETTRENPVIIRLIKQMVRITNIDSQLAADDLELEEKKAAQIEAEKPQVFKPLDPATCLHKSINIYGICNDCRKCLHSQNDGETCRTCGEPLAKATDFKMQRKA